MEFFTLALAVRNLAQRRRKKSAKCSSISRRIFTSIYQVRTSSQKSQTIRLSPVVCPLSGWNFHHWRDLMWARICEPALFGVATRTLAHNSIYMSIYLYPLYAYFGSRSLASESSVMGPRGRLCTCGHHWCG